jgi:hypothetical protein
VKKRAPSENVRDLRSGKANPFERARQAAESSRVMNGWRKIGRAFSGPSDHPLAKSAAEYTSRLPKKPPNRARALMAKKALGPLP